MINFLWVLNIIPWWHTFSRSLFILVRVVKIRPALEGDKEAFLLSLCVRTFKEKVIIFRSVASLSNWLISMKCSMDSWEQLFYWWHSFCANTSQKVCNYPFMLSTIMWLSLITCSTLRLQSVAVVLMHVPVGQSSISIDCIAFPTWTVAQRWKLIGWRFFLDFRDWRQLSCMEISLRLCALMYATLFYPVTLFDSSQALALLFESFLLQFETLELVPRVILKYTK